uniref:Extracellular globin n=2 Tax=Lamellibrachia satsuma TaxID=104711 RepID=S0BBR6_LAMSA|nr:A2 globin chain of giant V2 hemoglobin [Lamellibrachia satsuma]BAQ25615.1 A2 globin chain of giant V2 hemoglobin [Lamellibrachia satsuma]BAU46564.1 A2 globin chain of V1 giant hemoglobin [Lamellibrachia satsuma]
MKSLIAFMCLLAVAFASECGPLQRLKVKRQWAEAYGSGNGREEFGHFIWANVFKVAPSARDMFKRVRGDNIYTPAFRAHATRVLGGLDMCVALLDDESVLNTQLAHLASQHSSRGVSAEQYNVVEHAVMMGVEHEIGQNVFDKDAWQACLDVITSGIQGN